VTFMAYCFSLTTSSVVQNYFSVRQSFGVAKEKHDQFLNPLGSREAIFIVLVWAIGQ